MKSTLCDYPQFGISLSILAFESCVNTSKFVFRIKIAVAYERAAAFYSPNYGIDQIAYLIGLPLRWKTDGTSPKYNIVRE
jgi:hypothetical protein